MKVFSELYQSFISTVIDVFPVVLLIVSFQIWVLKKSIPNLKKIIIGVLMVICGLSFFLMGLEKALFPLGKMMAVQLSSPEFIETSVFSNGTSLSYFWIYVFAALIGFSTTIAEPSLIAVASKARNVSGGTIDEWWLRVTVAVGVAFALAVGTYRIVSGTPLYIYILIGYILVLIQTVFAPRQLIALAYDSGGVTTSTVTVPLVAALGLGLSSVVPGRNPALDGFGLIAFASLFPIITVLAYSQIMYYFKKNIKEENHEV